MSIKRIIPCLDIRNGRVVKGVNFEGVQDVSDPVALAAYYNESGADELVFYDITASFEERKLFIDILDRTVRENKLPLTVGGNILELDDFERVIDCGADKVSVNTGALKNPALIGSAAKKYGKAAVVLSMDVKRINGQFRVFMKGGREETSWDMRTWAKYGEDHGAGELVINSIDTDGVRSGFDIEMLAEAAAHVSLPIIASGGAGKKEDFLALFNAVPAIDAGLAASIFHFKEVNIGELKQYLQAAGVEMRL